jgi:hypothetical protein
MKLTKSKLKHIIKEELNHIKESDHLDHRGDPWISPEDMDELVGTKGGPSAWAKAGAARRAREAAASTPAASKKPKKQATANKINLMYVDLRKLEPMFKKNPDIRKLYDSALSAINDLNNKLAGSR